MAVTVAVPIAPAHAATWGAWTRMPELRVSAAPAVVEYGSGLIAFATDYSNRVLMSRSIPNLIAWSNWVDISGGLAWSQVSAGRGLGGEPVAFATQAGTTNVFYNQFVNGWPSGWVLVTPPIPSGFLVRSPAVAMPPAGGGSLLFAMGTPGRVMANRMFGSPIMFDGWSEVPGAMVTFDRPAAIADAFGTSVFIRANGNIVKTNRKVGDSFTGWTDLPAGGGCTNNAPAAATNSRKTFVFIVSCAGQQIAFATRTVSSVPQPFSAWEPIPIGVNGRTAASPTAAYWAGVPVVFIRGFDDKPYFSRQTSA